MTVVAPPAAEKVTSLPLDSCKPDETLARRGELGEQNPGPDRVQVAAIGMQQERGSEIGIAGDGYPVAVW